MARFSSRGTTAGGLSAELALAVCSAAIAIGLAFHLCGELASPRAMASTDFTVFRTGWELILRGQARELYDAAAQGRVQAELLRQAGFDGFRGGLMAFLHPPHAALAGSALGAIADRWGVALAFRLWTLCSVALLVKLARLASAQLGGGARETAAVAATLAGFYPTLIALQEGHVSILLAVALLAAVVAIREGRALAAGAWLVVLTIKPQILPALLVVLLVRRERRALAAAAAIGAAVVVATSLALGPRVWLDYATSLRALELNFGAGTPDWMPTVRGALTRLLGAGHPAAVAGATMAAWLAALAAVAVVAVRSRRAPDPAAALAFALAAGALTSPHLFPQDVVVWTAPVVLVLAAAPGAAWRARVALAWPLWFVVARVVDFAPDGPRLPIDPTLVPLVLATAWAGRTAEGA